MYRYQIWFQHKWGNRNSSPEEIVYSLDQALLRAKVLSKQSIFFPTSPNPFSIGASISGGVFKTPIVFVLDCCQVPSKLRGIAQHGKWRDAVDKCNSCNNLSMSEENCNVCGGACWSPYR